MPVNVPNPTASPFAASESYALHAPATMTAKTEPKRVTKPTFEYRRTVLALEGGRVLLRLRRNPMIEVNPETLECTILGWDIRLSHSEIENINRKMARRFLELFSKAQAKTLTEQDEAAWLRLQDEVDYAGFSHDRAAPHYIEGKLLRRSPICRVEWHDGTKEDLPPRVGHVLDALEPDDQFGAYVKLSTSGTAMSIEQLVLITDDSEAAT